MKAAAKPALALFSKKVLLAFPLVDSPAEAIACFRKKYPDGLEFITPWCPEKLRLKPPRGQANMQFSVGGKLRNELETFVPVESGWSVTSNPSSGSVFVKHANGDALALSGR